jgi:4-hydroxy-tetrahydrodipicolinate reductase
MNIALIGYGKMGREIEAIARSRNHQIPVIIDINNQDDLTVENLQKADVAIEFTIPEAAMNNFSRCFEAGIPVVSGTTGWLKHYDEIEKICREQGKGFFYASNFSLGVNLFFELNKRLARLMEPFDEYDVSMTETHHTQKLDAPSGTAITLARDIFDKLSRKNKWVKEKAASSDELPIKSIREGQVTGIHTITYDSDIDFIEITHHAKSRKGFALGAVLAAEFMKGKKGMFGMKDLLKL